GMRVVVELRRGAAPDVVLNNLYKHTPLRTSFSANMLALVDGMPRVLTLKEALRNFIEFRREVVVRRAEFDLRKARARLHILEGLRVALENLDRVIQLIRESADVETARSGLMTEFSLTQLQAQAILDMQLRRLAALEREKIETEYQEIVARIAELEALLADPNKVYGVVREETMDLKERYGDERRTVVHPEALGEWRREDTEPHEEVAITLSRNGYMKRMPAATYRAQHRGGKGVRGQRMTKEDDVTPHLIVADTHDTLLLFTDRGRVFAMRVFELPPDASRTSRGTPVSNLVSLEPRETVNAILAVSDLKEDTYLVMTTRQGQVKRMHLPQIANIRRAGLNAINLKSGDELVSAVLAEPDQDLVIISQEGMAIRFPTSQIRPRQRAAGGVRGMNLASGDQVVAADVTREDGSLLVVTKKGYGKLSPLRYYRQQGRGGNGVLSLRITRKNGKVADAAVVDGHVNGEDTVLLLTEKAQVLRIHLSEIRVTGRVTQGVILEKLGDGDAISAIRAMTQRHTPAELLSEEEVAAETGRGAQGHSEAAAGNGAAMADGNGHVASAAVAEAEEEEYEEYEEYAEDEEENGDGEED
ncbi:MAG: DNA gyrase C-terminal beta-propeller domain-containing protein, partial [Chloroflexota bacterium]